VMQVPMLSQPVLFDGMLLPYRIPHVKVDVIQS
jgi:hypothetical protein